MLNNLRKIFGYKFPRLGKTVNKLFFKLVNKLVKKKIRCELFPNIFVDLNLQDLTQQATFWMGDRFEYPTPQIFKDWGGSSDILFFDIGSNYGFYSYLMQSYFKNIKCYAFEPNPKTFGFFKDTVTANNLVNKIFPFNIGLGNKQEILTLHPGVEDSGHSTFSPHPEFKDTSIGMIKIDTFDNWRVLNNIEMPSSQRWIAKIDVEGFELKVLKGMEAALKSKAFIGISVEVLNFTLALNNNKPSDIEELLNSYGYIKIPKNKILEKYKRTKTENSFFVPEDSQFL